MKKLVVFVLLLTVISPMLLSFKDGVTLRRGDDKDGAFTFLIAGFDDAAENTDALLLLSYSPKNNAVSFLQIPRDTYYHSGTGTNRINSVYSSLIAKGEDRNDAMSALCSAVSGALGVKINGFAGYDKVAFKRIMKAIGDIEIYLPKDLTYDRNDGERVTLYKAGSQVFTSEEVLNFVRFREGYLMGDLGRVDAQKLFFGALAKKLRNDFGVKMVFKLLSVGSEGIVSDISPREMAALAIKNRGKIMDAKVYFATLPGTSTEEGSLGWYYAVNREASIKVIEALDLTKYREFDIEGRFLKSDSENFRAIYNKTGHSYRIYDENTLTEMDIKVG